MIGSPTTAVPTLWPIGKPSAVHPIETADEAGLTGSAAADGAGILPEFEELGFVGFISSFVPDFWLGRNGLDSSTFAIRTENFQKPKLIFEYCDFQELERELRDLRDVSIRRRTKEDDNLKDLSILFE